MQIRDLKKEMKEFYGQKAGEPSIIDVPLLNFLVIEGHGDPNGSKDYQDAIQTLYSAAYELKFAVKRSDMAVDFKVMPPEGLWWADDMKSFSEARKDLWKWKMMILQPDFITPEMVKSAIEQVKKKKNPPAIDKLRFESYTEGLSAQILHTGSYSEEGPNIERLHRFIEQNGYRLRGLHHEIYLSDTRKGDPAKWKTIIRQPMEK